MRKKLPIKVYYHVKAARNTDEITTNKDYLLLIFDSFSFLYSIITIHRVDEPFHSTKEKPIYAVYMILVCGFYPLLVRP